MRGLWTLAFGALLLGPPAAAAPQRIVSAPQRIVSAPQRIVSAPQRIVSMNLCTDEMALLLAGPERIASISFLGADPAESPIAAMARGIPVNHGLAEEVVAAKPDIVLTGRYTTGFAKAMLARLDYRVIELESPNTIEGIHRVFLDMGDALGEHDRAVVMLADMDRRLAAVAAHARSRPQRSAIVYDANGFTIGHPGLADDVMTIAGLTNKATELGIGAFGELGIETLLAAKPDLIVHLIYRPGEPSLASEMMNHPALRMITHHRAPLQVQGNLLTCGTPLVAGAAEQLAAELDALP